MEAYAMNSITQDVHQKNVVSQKMQNFFTTYRIGQILRKANACKITGVPAIQIVLFIFSMAFSSKSMYMEMKLHPEKASFGKDTFYRFMKSCHTNWRKFTSLLCLKIIKQTIEPLTSKDRLNVLIIDDSIYSRARSKKVELLAKVFDHAKHIYTYGFRMLTLCWSDGNTVLPVSHCLLSTENAKNRMQEASVSVDARSNGGRQRKIAQMKGTEVVLELLKEVKVVKEGRETPVRLVYVPNRNKKREYLVLATTDMSLSEDEIIRNYGKRWGIEVFFKVCKSYLKLSKESRSLSYDAMTAHVAIVFTRYMMLAVEQRESVDERSLGELFFISIEELSDVTLTTAVELIILEFVKQIERADVMDSDKLAAMVEKFIASLPSLIKQVNSVCQSEMLVAA